jgi:hypothetical protein
MKRSALLFLFTTVALLLAGAFGAARLASHYQRQLEAQPAAISRWESQIQQARQQRDALLNCLEAARQQPATAASATADSPTPDLTQATETERWVRKVKQLKQLFTQRPDQRIPEFAVLDEKDWLQFARRVELDTEDNRQRAFAIVRNNAKNRFVQFMRDALEVYVKTNHGQLPTDPTELQPYLFAPTLDSAMLAHYEMVRSGSLSDAPAGPVLKLKTLVNESYDDNVSIDRTADSSLNYSSERKRNPEDPNDAGSLNDQIEHDVTLAVRAFVAANHGTLPKSPAEIIPYFDPPLGPAMTEMINRPLTAETQKQFEADIVRMAGPRR